MSELLNWEIVLIIVGVELSESMRGEKSGWKGKCERSDIRGWMGRKVNG